MTEFKAEIIKGELIVKPIIEKNGNNVTVHVPSFKLIEELKRKIGKGDKHGIRHIQSV